MNFALATLTLALATSTMMAIGAQARVMRGTSTAALGRELEEEVELDLSLSLSLSMPNEKLVAAEFLAFTLDAGSNYTAAEQQQFTERFQKTAIGAAITEWLKENPEAAAASSSSASSSSSGKSGKIGFCDQYLDDFFFHIATTVGSTRRGRYQSLLLWRRPRTIWWSRS